MTASFTPIHTPADRMEWLISRRGGVGASDVVSILGLQKDWMKDAYQLWLDKTARVGVDLVSSEAAEWGTLLEPLIVERAGDRVGRSFDKGPTLQSVQYPWLRYSPDGWDPEHDEYIEAKNTSAYLFDDWTDNQVPDAAEVQVTTGMIVTGKRSAWVAGLIGGNHLIVRRVEFNQRLADIIIEATRTFWYDHVLADEAPPIGGSQSTMLAIRDQNGEHDGAHITDRPNTVRMWADQYTRSAADEKAAKAMKDTARNNIMELAQGHQSIVDADGTVLAKLQRGNFASKRFEAEYPDIADTTRRKVDILDVAAVKAEHPTEYRRHQSLSVRIPKPTPTTEQEN